MMPIRNRIRRESEVPLAAERARTAAETRRILTPEQQGKFDELYERFESRRKQMLSTPSGWALTAERSNEHFGSLARNSLADSNKNVACGGYDALAALSRSAVAGHDDHPLVVGFRARVAS
jgi:hypothetical protein